MTRPARSVIEALAAHAKIGINASRSSAFKAAISVSEKPCSFWNADKVLSITEAVSFVHSVKACVNCIYGLPCFWRSSPIWASVRRPFSWAISPKRLSNCICSLLIISTSSSESKPSAIAMVPSFTRTDNCFSMEARYSSRLMICFSTRYFPNN